jgi:hypothetical protein
MWGGWEEDVIEEQVDCSGYSKYLSRASIRSAAANPFAGEKVLLRQRIGNNSFHANTSHRETLQWTFNRQKFLFSFFPFFYDLCLGCTQAMLQSCLDRTNFTQDSMNHWYFHTLNPPDPTETDLHLRGFIGLGGFSLPAEQPPSPYKYFFGYNVLCMSIATTSKSRKEWATNCDYLLLEASSSAYLRHDICRKHIASQMCNGRFPKIPEKT